jgi:hypothetical protein
MLKTIFFTAAFFAVLNTDAQNDSVAKSNVRGNDTLHVGNMVILRNGSNDEDTMNIRPRHHRNYHPSNITTNWVIVDLGFANYNDMTVYPSSFAKGSTKDWFNLKTGKSVDVNIWVFMQRLNLIKHVVNLKYGLGVELNNYRYDAPILFSENPQTEVTYDSLRHYHKNKLATDYATIPLMLNFNFTPHKRRGYGISLGASAGYLYSSRQKTITSENGKQKTHDEFDLNPWKISWIGEIQLGIIDLYGSYATRSMFRDGLDQVPYTIGIRLGNW